MRKKNILLIALISLLLTGCTTQRQLSYFNDLDSSQNDAINSKSSFMHETKIKAGDMLIITVIGSDPKAVAVFNLPVISYSAPGSESIYGMQSQQAYTVDMEGTIQFPVLGDIHIAGKTRSEAIDVLSSRLTEYIQDPIVSIKYLNFNVTVLGEVLRPGQYPINNDRTTLLDALGLAGDMTPFGKRNTVLITRENNGKIEFERLNLNDVSLFNSPYYYVQQNDVIYVEPNKVRSISSQNIPLYLSSLSTLATLVTLIYSISRK